MKIGRMYGNHSVSRYKKSHLSGLSRKIFCRDTLLKFKTFSMDLIINFFGRNTLGLLRKSGGKLHYLWRAIDHEGEVLETIATKKRGRKAALKLLKKLLKQYGRPVSIVTDRFRS